MSTVLKYQTRYVIDTAILNYKLIQHTIIEDIVNSMSVNNLDSIIDFSLKMKLFLEENFNQNSNLRKSQIESLFFHQGILNTEKRHLSEINHLIVCCPHPDYILGKSFFWCVEDYFVNTDQLKSIFITHPELKDDPFSRKIYDYLYSISEDSISYDKIYFLNFTKADYLKTLDNIRSGGTASNRVSFCLLGSGSGLGCCGNYSGCCLLWTFLCLEHDLLCLHCRPRWFCFNGCVPEN